MRINLIILLLAIANFLSFGQEKYTTSFVSDTMTIPSLKKVVEGEYLETVLKDQSTVRFFKTSDGKYYLRFIVTRNFYFDKVANLEIRSGSKSSHEKEVKQFKVSKTSGLFIVEVYKNYFNTYKNAGITSIVFGDAETTFSRQDANQIKKIAEIFYDTIYSTK